MTYRSPFIAETNEPAFTDCHTRRATPAPAKKVDGRNDLDTFRDLMDAHAL